MLSHTHMPPDPDKDDVAWWKMHLVAAAIHIVGGAVRLSGRVLVAGGYGEDQRPLVSAEIYAEAGWSPVSLAAAMRAGLFRKSDEAVLPPPGCPILEGDIDPKRSARHYRSVLLG